MSAIRNVPVPKGADNFVTKRSPDPKDDPILAVAIAGDVGLVVSGDRSDMLALGDVAGIPIRSAREALGIALKAKAR